jgi:hypothetical protein
MKMLCKILDDPIDSDDVLASAPGWTSQNASKTENLKGSKFNFGSSVLKHVLGAQMCSEPNQEDET